MSVRPVLLTVDDDPAVSRAVARDLRRRYGEENWVVRAESGADALAALRELTVRGEPTALLLADHRMPEMNGVEFLEQAIDLVPDAKRVLLTAYADTNAAIRAINDVDLDHPPRGVRRAVRAYVERRHHAALTFTPARPAPSSRSGCRSCRTWPDGS